MKYIARQIWLNGYQTAGITGHASSSTDSIYSVEISNCYNSGLVHGIGSLGGIVNFGRNVIVNNSYNIGILAIETWDSRGGIIATQEGNRNQYNNNYWLDTCGGVYGIHNASSNEGAEPKTSDEIKNLYNILGDAYTKDLYNQNNGYPILKWQLEK